MYISAVNLFVLMLTVISMCGASANESNQKCQASGCAQPDITARSCLDYLKKGFKTNGDYQIYNFNANTFITVYCDMNSEAGAAWTLIESFSLKNKGLVQFYKHSLLTNAPVNEHSPNWNLYRMNLPQMSHLKSQSTHWRVTCSFPTHGVDYTDYARAKFTSFDIMTFQSTHQGNCKHMEYINIRGHQCAQCTARWWQIVNTYGPTIDSSSSGCQLNPTGGAVPSEDNFGYYHNINSKFRCTSGASSTTNWWFGGYQ